MDVNNPVATGPRDRHRGARVPAAKQLEGFPLALLLALVFLSWPFVCWLAARLAHDLTGGRRSAYWATFLVLLLLPWTNTLIGYAVAASYYARVGRLIPEAPITVPGFLLASGRDQTYPNLYQFLAISRFDFVEIQYSRNVAGTPSMDSGPGFYQFRLADSSVADCATAGVSGKPVGIFATGGYCYSYTRSDFPISRYVYQDDPRKSLRSNVKVYCVKITDLRNQEDVVRSCVLHVTTLLGLDARVGAIQGEVIDMLQPQPTLSNSLDGKPE
jgi:hypothetical protein